MPVPAHNRVSARIESEPFKLRGELPIRPGQGCLVISLRRYLDGDPETAALLRSMIEAYQNTLGAIGAGAAHASPSLDTDLEKQLAALGRDMAAADTAEAIDATAAKVSERVDGWAEQA